MKTKVKKYRDTLSIRVPDFITLERVAAWKTYQNLINRGSRSVVQRIARFVFQPNKDIKKNVSTLCAEYEYTRVGTLIVTTIYLQLIQNRYMFRSFTVLQCSHQHCVQPVASDVEVVGYL